MQDAIGAFTGLSVDDIGKAKDFYTETLKLPLKDESMGLLLDLPGGGQLFIYEKQDHIPATYTVLNFMIENINETVDRLTAQGITFVHYDNLPAAQDEKEILRGKMAGRGPDIAWFKDPAGNILAVLEN